MGPAGDGGVRPRDTYHGATLFIFFVTLNFTNVHTAEQAEQAPGGDSKRVSAAL